MTQQGIDKAELSGIQAFVRTLKNKDRENPDPVALYIMDDSSNWSDTAILHEANSVYARRYGSIYSKGMKGTLREKNAAFKVKFFHEAVRGVPEGSWNDEYGVWVDALPLSEMLSEVNNLLYTEALKVIHCKIADYHSCAKVQTLLDFK